MSNQLASSSRRSSARPRSAGSLPASVDQLGAAVDEELDPLGQRVELAQQRHARRRQRRRATRARRRRASAGSAPAAARAQQSSTASWSMSNSSAEQPQEALAPGRVERQIGAAEFGGAGARRDLAAAAVEAAQHLLAQPRDVVVRQVGARRAGQDAARRAGDLAPGAAQIGQACGRTRRRESRRSAIAHAGPRLLASAEIKPGRSTTHGASFARPAAPRARRAARRPGPRRRARAEAARRLAVQPAPPPPPPRTPACPAPAAPSTMPARTSPEPAVASSGGAFSLIAARPSGAAITVSAPFSRTTAPLSPRGAAGARRACCRAGWSNRRANSPSCGVITHRACGSPRTESARSPAKTVSASASSTVRLPRGEDRQRLVAGLGADPGARADQRGVAPRVGEQRREIARCRRPAAR